MEKPLQKQKLKTVSSISINYQNLGGVRTRLYQLSCAISQCDYDIISIVKSRLNEDYCNNDLSDLKYQTDVLNIEHLSIQVELDKL